MPMRLPERIPPRRPRGRRHPPDRPRQLDPNPFSLADLRRPRGRDRRPRRERPRARHPGPPGRGAGPEAGELGDPLRPPPAGPAPGPRAGGGPLRGPATSARRRPAGRRPRIQPPAPQDVQPDDAGGRRPRGALDCAAGSAGWRTCRRANSPDRVSGRELPMSEFRRSRRSSEYRRSGTRARPGTDRRGHRPADRPRRQGPLPPGPGHLADGRGGRHPGPQRRRPARRRHQDRSTPPTRTSAAATASPPGSARPRTTSGRSATTGPSASPTPARSRRPSSPTPSTTSRSPAAWSSTRWPAAGRPSTSASRWAAAASRMTSHPVRPEIRRHDVSDRLPARGRRMRPDLLRPPLSHHARPTVRRRRRRHGPAVRLGRFLARLARDAFATLRPGGLRRPAPGQPDREGPARRVTATSITPSLAIAALLGAGFLPRAADQLPDGRGLPAPARPQARAEGRMLGQVRDLLVVRKPLHSGESTCGDDTVLGPVARG